MTKRFSKNENPFFVANHLSRKIIMDKLNSLLLAEFYTATGYFDRLIFAFSDLEHLHNLPRGKAQMQKFIEETNRFFEDELYSLNFEATQTDWTDYKKIIKNYNGLIEAFLKSPFRSDKVITAAVNYINHLYKHCFEIHNFVIDSTVIEIQLPRLGLIQEENIESINGAAQKAPLFYLDEINVRQYHQENIKSNSSLVFLDIRREEKYDELLHKGHMSIAQNEYEEARKYFYMARNYKETAEILTLLAWTYSLLEDRQQAKIYCLQAVKKDSQYGPAYNDYGNYLLSEGQVEESIRWFELAKRALNYQNREYPYINAGRAHALLKNFDQALKEFSLALTIAPHHIELHETVAKLKDSLNSKMDFTENDNVRDNGTPII